MITSPNCTRPRQWQWLPTYPNKPSFGRHKGGVLVPLLPGQSCSPKRTGCQLGYWFLSWAKRLSGRHFFFSLQHRVKKVILEDDIRMRRWRNSNVRGGFRISDENEPRVHISGAEQCTACLKTGPYLSE
jgi:hypothetical protein